jgi:peroxiredoxin
LRRFEHRRPRFEELGIRMVTVSPDTVAETAAMRRRLRLGMKMLSDESLDVTDLYNLRHDNALAGGSRGSRRPLAIPATVLIDADGVVRWVFRSVDFRVRSNPDDALDAAVRILAGSENPVAPAQAPA